MRKQKASEGVSLVGKRVVSFALLPQMTVLGTIQEVERFDTGVEYWQVLIDGGITQNARREQFALYEGPEFAAGDRVNYRLDEGGYWEATVLGPQWMFDHLRYTIQVTDGSQAKVKGEAGYTFSIYPERLSKIGGHNYEKTVYGAFTKCPGSAPGKWGNLSLPLRGGNFSRHTARASWLDGHISRRDDDRRMLASEHPRTNRI